MGKPTLTLNRAQQKAVETIYGPVLILAGAGAGKTKVIVERIHHFIRKGVKPSSILAITFTNKAAKEMRDRISQRLHEDSDLNRPISMGGLPFVSTFHSLGVHILREQSQKLGLKRHFTIFDRDDSKKAVKEALQNLNFDPKIHDPGRFMFIISREKGQGTNSGEYADAVTSGSRRGSIAEILMQVWPEYEKILKRDVALDFDDLLLKTLDLLKKDHEVAEYYRNTWIYIHIDEYQDTNRVQYEISKILVGNNKNLCAVGDIDQNIYSWRGAEIKNIIDFEKDYPEAEVVVLEENYRSTKTILDAANAIIEKNKIRREKNLFTGKGSGEKISLFSGFDEASETDFIAVKCDEFIKKGVSPDEIAVLYRANFQSRILEEAFMNYGLPYQILGTKFFERKEIKDILSYLRAGLNPESLSDLKRVINVPTRGVGKATLAKVFSGQEETLSPSIKLKLKNFRSLLREIGEHAKKLKPSETIAFIIKKTGLEDEWRSGGEEGAARLENAYELVNFANRYDSLGAEEGILSLLSDTALQSDQDEMDEKKKAVRLMTVHAAKGLEFDIVFISGLEDGLFPHQKISESRVTPEESEEERRLFYVALTRAREKVFLTYAQTRIVFGSRRVNMPSQFICDIPDKLLEEEGKEESIRYKKPLLDIDF